MKIVTPPPNESLNISLRPGPDESMRSVSGKVTALVVLGSQNTSAAFNEVGMASIPNVPAEIFAAKKVEVRVESQDYRVKADAQGNAPNFFEIKLGNRIDIPLERLPLPPIRYLECRAPSNGIEQEGAEVTVSKESNWMAGGFDPTQWCTQAIAVLRGQNAGAEFSVANTAEEKRDSCSPFNCVQYKYTCVVKIRTQPIYKLAAGPDCGVAH